jgi:hypothetical protein
MHLNLSGYSEEKPRAQGEGRGGGEKRKNIDPAERGISFFLTNPNENVNSGECILA